MRLPCLKAIALLLAGIACSDSSGPRSRTSAIYLLESINGQRLPTTIGPIPEAGTIVLEGRVFLQEGGYASTFERRLEFSQNVPTDKRYFLEWRHTVSGNALEMRPQEPCPAHANCVEIAGVLSEPMLTLEFGPLSYSYRRELPPAL